MNLIEGHKINLRLPLESDAPFMLRWENADSEMLYNLHSENLNEEDVRAWVKEKKHDVLLEKELRLIMVTKQNEIAGSVDLFELDSENGHAGLGIIVEEKHRAKGIATEAIFLVKDYCFQTLKLSSLWCNISAANAISINLFEKCGFELSGIRRRWKRNADNELTDVLFYQSFG